MKQFMLMIFVTTLGSVASLIEPFWGLMLYYTFAVLRPQHLWIWALPVELRWSLFAALVVLISSALNYSWLAEKMRFNLVLTLMLIHGVLLVISVLGAYDPVVAQKWGIEYAKIILMAFMATLLVRQLWQVRVVAIMILLMLGYIGWEINSLYLFDGRLDIFHYGYAGLDNNGAGLMMAMGLPFAYSFGTSAPRLWQRGFSWLLGIFMLHAMLMSYSRGAMLASSVGVIWLLINHRPRIQAGLITAVLCLAVSVLAGQEIQERFLSTANYRTDYSAQSRLASWAVAWELAWERPLVGQGIRNSSQYVYNYGADRRGRTIHNQFLQVAADSGIPAAVVYLAMLIAALFFLQKSRGMCSDYISDNQRSRDGPSDDQVRLIRQIGKIMLGCQASLIIFFTGGVFLSLELVELPWLLITLAGATPTLLRLHFEKLTPKILKETPDRQSIHRTPAYPPRLVTSPGV